MNIIRILIQFIKTIAGFIFILSLSLFIIVWSLVEFTGYNTLKPLVTNLLSTQLSQQIDQQYFIQIHSFLVNQCFISGNETVEFRFVGENISLKCSDVKSSTSENFTELVSGSVFDSLYYKKYDCEFIECLKQSKENIFVLLSAYANNFLKNIQIYLLLGSVISGGVILLVNKTWSARLKEIGILMIFVGLPAFMLKSMKNTLKTSLISKEALPSVEPIIDKLFMIIEHKSMFILIPGIGITLVGFSLWIYEKFKKPKKA